MNRCFACSLLIFVAAFSAAGSEPPRAMARVSAGVAGIALASEGEPFRSAGPAATAGLSLRAFGPVRFGFNAGIGPLFSPSSSPQSLLYILNATAGYDFGNGIKVDVGYPLLPSVSLTVDRLVVSLGVFPFYLDSGGGTFFYLLFGRELGLW